MRLSDAKPCICCGGPLTKRSMINWYVIRVSTAIVNPRVANTVLGTMQITGSLQIAEAMAPGAEDAIAIVGDLPGSTWTELHICFDCFTDGHLGDLPCLAVKQQDADRQAEQEKERA